MVRGTETTNNPVYTRLARLSIMVDNDWLTAEGEGDAQEGWKEIQAEVERAILRLHIRGLVVAWEEWEGEAEVETGAWALREYSKRKNR